jgi:hypothetical protein
MRCDACGNASLLTGVEHIRWKQRPRCTCTAKHRDNSIHVVLRETIRHDVGSPSTDEISALVAVERHEPPPLSGARLQDLIERCHARECGFNGTSLCQPIADREETESFIMVR